MGLDVKWGIYGDEFDNDTTIRATSLATPTLESQTATETSFVGEMNFMLMYRLFHQTSFRAGYQLMWIEDVGLAPDNFNTASPLPALPSRPLFLLTDESVFMQGVHVGLECQW